MRTRDGKRGLQNDAGFYCLQHQPKQLSTSIVVVYGSNILEAVVLEPIVLPHVYRVGTLQRTCTSLQPQSSAIRTCDYEGSPGNPDGEEITTFL